MDFVGIYNTTRWDEVMICTSWVGLAEDFGHTSMEVILRYEVPITVNSILESAQNGIITVLDRPECSMDKGKFIFNTGS